MVAYWVITYFIFLFSVFEVFVSGKYKSIRRVAKYNFIIITVLLIIFVGVRGPGTGMDDPQYVNFYFMSHQQFDIFGYDKVVEIYRYEGFFSLLAYLLSFFTSDGYCFLFFVGFIAVTANAYSYIKYSPYFILSLCLYSAHLMINKDMNQIRFGLSSVFSVLMLFNLIHKNYKLSVLFFLLSITSHSTGFGVLLFLPFLIIPKRSYYPLVMLILAIPIGMVGGKHLILDSLHLNFSLADKVNDYVGSVYDTDTPVFSVGNFKNIAFIVIFYYILLRKKDVNEMEGRLYYYVLVFYSIGAVVRIVFSDFSILGGRLGNLFLHVEPFLISYAIYKLKNKFLAMMVFFMIITYYLLYNTLLNPQSISGYNVSSHFLIF